MNMVDYYAAKKLHDKRETWRVVIENTTPGHNKFWEGSETNESVASGHVLVRYGRIGSEGTTILKNWKYFETKLREKLADGYAYHRNTELTHAKSEVKPDESSIVVRPGPFGIKDVVPVAEIKETREDRLKRGLKPNGAAARFAKDKEKFEKEKKEREERLPSGERDLGSLMERRKRASSW